MDANVHQRNIDGAMEQINDRQTRIQAEVTRTVMTMARKEIFVVSMDVFEKVRTVGINRMNSGNYYKAFEIWDMLVKQEYRVLVFHRGSWRVGICIGGSFWTFWRSPEREKSDPRSYDIKLQEGGVLTGIQSELVIIRNDNIVRLQRELADLRKYLRTIS